ncbi:glycosyltransferase family 2 protein [Devosia beringensis]|uniref:glycosyltransferase family 2 protein n=1 Tax=Devosia beringensis TaxID=2657486 RepID=UPI00186BA222|nr:glycosyltransferase family 2 protein [Devosia beringensis]
MPKISVVIPLYNKGPHILRTLASVQAQTLRPDEIIVVDDGSSDGGYEAVQGLEIPGLQLHRRAHPGPAGSAARNLGANVASGEWIALLDADDEWLPNHLEVFTETLKRAPTQDRVAAVFSGFTNIYPDGRQSTDPFTARYAPKVADALEFTDLVSLWLEMGTSPIWTSAVVVRREALIEAGMFPAERCTRGEDKDTWLRVAHVGVCLPTKQITAVYHRDAVNMTTKLRYANQRPCIEHSIVGLLEDSPEHIDLLLKRLANVEIYNYALATTKYETLRAECWQGFYGAVDPFRAFALRALSVPILSWLVRSIARMRSRD